MYLMIDFQNQGDSGGPLVCKQKGKKYLAGIISWGAECGHPILPGVHTSILPYRSWILKNIGPKPDSGGPPAKQVGNIGYM